MRVERLVRIQIQDTLRLTAGRLEKRKFRDFKAFRRAAEKDIPWDRKSATNLRTEWWDALVFKLYMVMRQRRMILFPWYMPIIFKARATIRLIRRLGQRLIMRHCEVCGKPTVLVHECAECRVNYSKARAQAFKEIKAGARKTADELLRELP